jgi:hypothetical protein
MKNITLAIDEVTLEQSREYAKRHHTSLNGMVRDFLERTVKRDSGDWPEEMFRLMDEAHGHSDGQKWTREDAYDREIGRYEPRADYPGREG